MSAAHKRKVQQAIAHLSERDPAMGALIRRAGPCTWAGKTDHTHFGYVLRCIVYQQLSGKAAATIFGRVQAIYGGDLPTPEQILRTKHAKLRAAGLSERKVEYAKELAKRCNSGELALASLGEMDDDAVIETLVQVKGIGRWTAQMVLMFHLGRHDVFPELDLGVQKGLQKLLKLRRLPTPERTAKEGARWAPYRTVAAWYLWRNVELPD